MIHLCYENCAPCVRDGAKTKKTKLNLLTRSAPQIQKTDFSYEENFYYFGS